MQPRDYQALATFRYEVRSFLDFSRRFLDGEGLPPVQYQAMLAIEAHSDRPYTISDLAAELFIKVHTAGELVKRMERGGLLERSVDTADRRRTMLHLSAKAKTLLPALAARHLAELKGKAPSLLTAIARLKDRDDVVG